MLTWLVLVKLCAEIALFAMAGQWALRLLLGVRAAGNLVFELLQIVTRPVVVATSWLLPKRVGVPQHSKWAAALLLLVWLCATVAKVWLCLDVGVARCR